MSSGDHAHAFGQYNTPANPEAGNIRFRYDLRNAYDQYLILSGTQANRLDFYPQRPLSMGLVALLKHNGAFGMWTAAPDAAVSGTSRR